MDFILLCHSRELTKNSNTGQLAVAQPELSVRQILWQRKEPDIQLLSDVVNGNCWLLYPSDAESGMRLCCVAEADQNLGLDSLTPILGADAKIILIDSTWQQARKIFNQSGYLHHLPRLQLYREKPSMFRLRRNQKHGGLCTIECVVELLYLQGRVALAKSLDAKFEKFMSQPKVVL